MIDQYPSQNGVLTSLIWRKTAAGGETSLSGYDNASQALSYTPGQEQVYLNGILLVRGDDYTATNGTSITGLAALAANDFVQINCYNNFSVASTPATSITGTIANNQLANSAITINGTATSLGGTYTNASASTSTAGIVQLTDSISSTSITTAATPNSVKSAYDLANGAIPKSLTTTTGDIIYASSANTPTRLGIGSSGQVLTVSGGVPTWGAAPSGKLLQAVSGTTTTIVTTTGDVPTDSTLSASITPTSSSSKILVLTTQLVQISRVSSNGKTGVVRLVRNSTPLQTWDNGVDLAGIQVAVNSSNQIDLSTWVSFAYLDSPNTTSATTYKTQIYNTVSSSTTIQAQKGNFTGSIVLMEIGA